MTAYCLTACLGFLKWLLRKDLARIRKWGFPCIPLPPLLSGEPLLLYAFPLAVRKFPNSTPAGHAFVTDAVWIGNGKAYDCPSVEQCAH